MCKQVNMDFLEKVLIQTKSRLGNSNITYNILTTYNHGKIQASKHPKYHYEACTLRAKEKHAVPAVGIHFENGKNNNGKDYQEAINVMNILLANCGNSLSVWNFISNKYKNGNVKLSIEPYGQSGFKVNWTSTKLAYNEINGVKVINQDILNMMVDCFYQTINILNQQYPL